MTGEFADTVCELLAPMGDVRARRMFGGWGVYLDGVMFALIADDTLYFRTDDQTRPAYEAEGLARFQPFPDKPARMPYHRAPDETLDDRDAMLAWGRPAFEAALRARAVAKPKKRRKADALP